MKKIQINIKCYKPESPIFIVFRMKNQKRQKVTYLLLILSLFGFLISSFAYGYTQKTEEISGEFKGNFRLFAGPKNTVHLFYLSNFISYDFGFDDLVVMSAVDLNFSAPIRVGGETNSYHEDRARLLNAIEFEDSGIITFYTDPDGLDTWGFYGREWNSGILLILYLLAPIFKHILARKKMTVTTSILEGIYQPLLMPNVNYM